MKETTYNPSLEETTAFANAQSEIMVQISKYGLVHGKVKPSNIKNGFMVVGTEIYFKAEDVKEIRPTYCEIVLKEPMREKIPIILPIGIESKL